MKNKTICLEDEIFNKLAKENNASAIINKMLKEHYKITEKTLEELKKELRVAEVEEELDKIRQEKLKEIACLQLKN